MAAKNESLTKEVERLRHLEQIRAVLVWNQNANNRNGPNKNTAPGRSNLGCYNCGQSGDEIALCRDHRIVVFQISIIQIWQQWKTEMSTGTPMMDKVHPYKWEGYQKRIAEHRVPNKCNETVKFEIVLNFKNAVILFWLWLSEHLLAGFILLWISRSKHQLQ